MWRSDDNRRVREGASRHNVGSVVHHKGGNNEFGYDEQETRVRSTPVEFELAHRLLPREVLGKRSL